MYRIIVSENGQDAKKSLGSAFIDFGYKAEFAQGSEATLDLLSNGDDPFDVLLLDIPAPSAEHIQTLRDLRSVHPDLPVLVLSIAASPSDVVTALRAGAIDFLPKPVSLDDLRNAIENTVSAAPQNRPQSKKETDGWDNTATQVTGVWPRKVELLLSQVSGSDVPLLLRGETGVGKEVLARKFHARSPRAAHPFLKLNCAALPSELVESELFGYERGAFTGALKSSPGKFEMANRGTILLDEIGDMDFKLQAKLLQVLQDKEFIRLGAKETCRVDVRVMAATHTDLEQAITDGTFREDLFYRLNIIDIHIPPLRERRDEVLTLAETLLRKHATHEGQCEIPAVLQQAFLEHDWPGNVRELENFIRKFLVLGNPAMLAEDLLKKSRRAKTQIPAIAPQPMPEPAVQPSSTPTEAAPVFSKVEDARKAAETQAILAALGTTRWNRKQAASLLQIEYKALLYKMKKLKIGEPSSASASDPESEEATDSDAHACV